MGLKMKVAPVSATDITNHMFSQDHTTSGLNRNNQNDSTFLKVSHLLCLASYVMPLSSRWLEVTKALSLMVMVIGLAPGHRHFNGKSHSSKASLRTEPG